MRFALILIVPIFLSAYAAPQAKASSDPTIQVKMDFALGRELRDKCATTNDVSDCQKLRDYNAGFSGWEGSTSHYPAVLFLTPAN